MNQERLLQVLLEPRISEKATRLGERNRQYVFRVVSDANKQEIRAAVEQLFKVEVEGVQVSNVPARAKRFRGQLGVRSAWKKAYVKLKPGFEIDYMGSD